MIDRETRIMEGGSIGKRVLQYVLPSIAAMLMVLAYNLADTFFIGQTHNALQLAAISVATPVFLFFMATGTIFGVGGTSLISRALGEGNTEYAKKACSFCLWGCVAAGVGMTALFLGCTDQILALVATEVTWEYARKYLTIVSWSGTFVLISTCFSNVVRAEGRSVQAMMGSLIGNLINIVLDPILILALDWDVAGAAVATVIGNVAGAAWYLAYFKFGHSRLSIRPRDCTGGNGVAKGVLAIGVPAALGTLLMSVSAILLNSRMAPYGDMAIAGIGVASKISMVVGTICVGLGQGVQPLLGFYVGARSWDMYKRSLRFSLWFALLASGAMTALCYLFTRQIAGAFLTDPTALEYAVKFARILLSTTFLFGLYYVLVAALQACGAALDSLIVNVSRQGIVYIPAMLILGAISHELGLVWAQPVADVISLLLAWILYTRRIRRMTSGMVSALVPADADT